MGYQNFWSFHSILLKLKLLQNLYKIETENWKSQKKWNKKPRVKSSSADNYIITQQLVCIALRKTLNHFCFNVSFKYDTIVLVTCLRASKHLFLWWFTMPLSTSKHTLYLLIFLLAQSFSFPRMCCGIMVLYHLTYIVWF